MLDAVPRGFLDTLLTALRFWALARLAIRRCLLGTFGLPREGIVMMISGDCAGVGLNVEVENKIIQRRRGSADRFSDPKDRAQPRQCRQSQLASKANFFQHQEGHRQIVPSLSAVALCSRSGLVHYLRNPTRVRTKTPQSCRGQVRSPSGFDLSAHPACLANSRRLQEECQPGDNPGDDEDWSRREDK